MSPPHSTIANTTQLLDIDAFPANVYTYKTPDSAPVIG